VAQKKKGADGAPQVSPNTSSLGGREMMQNAAAILLPRAKFLFVEASAGRIGQDRAGAGSAASPMIENCSCKLQEPARLSLAGSGNIFATATATEPLVDAIEQNIGFRKQ
jgi:hypothetical protein